MSNFSASFELAGEVNRGKDARQAGLLRALAEGDLEDDLITCPVHWGQFDVRTGEAVTFPCEKHLRTYQIIVTDKEVFADVAKEAEEALAADLA